MPALRPVYERQGQDTCRCDTCSQEPEGFKRWEHYLYLRHIAIHPAAVRYAALLKTQEQNDRLSTPAPVVSRPHTPPLDPLRHARASSVLHSSSPPLYPPLQSSSPPPQLVEDSLFQSGSDSPHSGSLAMSSSMGPIPPPAPIPSMPPPLPPDGLVEMDMVVAPDPNMMLPPPLPPPPQQGEYVVQHSPTEYGVQHLPTMAPGEYPMAQMHPHRHLHGPLM